MALLFLLLTFALGASADRMLVQHVWPMPYNFADPDQHLSLVVDMSLRWTGPYSLSDLQPGPGPFLPAPRLANGLKVTPDRYLVNAQPQGNDSIDLYFRVGGLVSCLIQRPFLFPFDVSTCDLVFALDLPINSSAFWHFDATETDLLVIGADSFAGNSHVLASTQSSLYSARCSILSNGPVANVFKAASCLRLRLQLSRMRSRQLTSTYLPVGLLACMTFLLPWIEHLNVPARVIFGCLTVIQLVSQVSMTKSYVPCSVTYSMLDVWMHVCLILALVACVEFVTIHRAQRSANRQEKRADSFGSNSNLGSIAPGNGVAGNGTNDGGTSFPADTRRDGGLEAAARGLRPKMFDVGARVLFPTIFTIFNAVYWTTFLIMLRQS